MKVLCYFLHNPWPPKSGAHQRCLQILRGLRSAGCDVIFASATIHTEQPWSGEGKDALRDITGQEVRVFDGPGKIGKMVDRLERKVRQWIPGGHVLYDTLFCPYSLVRWFRALVADTDPDVVLINYAWFDQLVDHRAARRRHCVMETHDLISVNWQMRAFAESQLDRCVEGPYASKLREEFNDARPSFRVDPEEVEIYQSYDTVVCISRREQEVLSHLKGPRVIRQPFVIEPSPAINTYDGPPVLSLGPNPFNLQGYLYFLDAVLPCIRTQIADFRLIVTGGLNPVPRPAREIDWRGFVDDRDALFRDAGYSVCPIFGGTGQQIKIVEAMAHGLAVVAFEEAAENSFLQDGENGLVARSAAEFAEHVLRLHRDKELRIRLGSAAKKTIAKEYTEHWAIPELMRVLKPLEWS